MVDLHGSLATIEIGPLTRFLCELGKSGDLLLSNAGWIGQVSLDAGVVTEARIESDSGLDALRAIGSTMLEGEFEFVEGSPTLARNPSLGADAVAILEQHRQDRTLWGAQLPRPTDVPHRVPSSDNEAAAFKLERSTVYLLLQVDGRSDVRELAKSHGLWHTLNGLGQLREFGFIQLQPGEPAEPLLDVEQTQSQPAPTPRAAFRGATRVGFELVQAIVVSAAIVFGLRSLVLNFRVEGISMQPTFASGEVLLVNRAAYFHVDWTPLTRLLPLQRQGRINYLFGGPQRGDVVIFDAPPQPGTDYIKRIIGLPGDMVSVEAGVVRVNGVPLSEPYIHAPADYRFPASGEARVPDDSYFVLGDNRPDSFDSHFGWFVPVQDLVGEAWIRYWPPSDASVVKSGAPTDTASAASASLSTPSN